MLFSLLFPRVFRCRFIYDATFVLCAMVIIIQMLCLIKRANEAISTAIYLRTHTHTHIHTPQDTTMFSVIIANLFDLINIFWTEWNRYITKIRAHNHNRTCHCVSVYVRKMRWNDFACNEFLDLYTCYMKNRDG